MTMTDDHGTEHKPIDLTGEEVLNQPSGKEKTAKLLKKLKKRVHSLETAYQETNKKIKNATNNEVGGLRDKCQNLESRLSNIEDFLQRLSSAFPVTLITSNRDIVDRKSDPVTSFQGNSILENGVQSTGNCQRVEESLQFDTGGNYTNTQEREAICLEDIVVLCASTHGSDSASIHSDETIINHHNMENGFESQEPSYESQTVNLSNENYQGPTTCVVDLVGVPVNNSDVVEASELSETFPLLPQTHESGENGDGPRADEEDTKLHPALIPFTSLYAVKEEIKFIRDDFGRILMFICCSANRMRRNTSQIVSIAGTFLLDEIHNEYPFSSERNMKDVKVEGEIRGALFGLEVLKDIFQEKIGGVCVMIISSCAYLVQHMKADRFYPNFYKCSCKDRDCEHSESRWFSEDSLAKAQSLILPDLYMSIQNLKVHWCKLESTSAEEKTIMTNYRNVVDTALVEYIRT